MTLIAPRTPTLALSRSQPAVTRAGTCCAALGGAHARSQQNGTDEKLTMPKRNCVDPLPLLLLFVAISIACALTCRASPGPRSCPCGSRESPPPPRRTRKTASATLPSNRRGYSPPEAWCDKTRRFRHRARRFFDMEHVSRATRARG